MVKNLPAVGEIGIRSLSWEDSLEKGMATHSSILAWRIPWTEEPGGLRPWGHKESDTTEPRTQHSQSSFHTLILILLNFWDDFFFPLSLCVCLT